MTKDSINLIPSESTSTERIEWLDYMRGFAILTVVIGHLAQSLQGNHPFAGLIIVYEMPLFFCLSGILAKKTSQRTLLYNIRKKAQSLLIPYIAIGSLFALTFGAFQDFLFNTYHNGYWFLLCLFSCWLIFLPIEKLCNRIKGKYNTFWEFCLLLFPFIVYKCISDLIPVGIEQALTLNFTFTYYRFFIVGYYIGKYLYVYKINDVLGVAIMVCVVFVSIIILNSSVASSYIPMTIKQLVLSAGLMYMFYIYYQYSSQKVRKLLSWFGKGSLYIYTLHFFIKPYAKLSFLTDVSELWVLLSTIFASIVVCVICLILIIPIKSNKYLSLFLLGQKK